jgi:hypothetical protein
MRPNAYVDANVAPRFLRLETLLQIAEILDFQDTITEVDR